MSFGNLNGSCPHLLLILQGQGHPRLVISGGHPPPKQGCQIPPMQTDSDPHGVIRCNQGGAVLIKGVKVNKVYLGHVAIPCHINQIPPTIPTQAKRKAKP